MRQFWWIVFGICAGKDAVKAIDASSALSSN
jgi:hypothetical protein